MLTLELCRALRLNKGLRRPHISAVTGIHGSRLHQIELKEIEPWFDEALLLSQALCSGGIVPLMIPSGNLTDIKVEFLVGIDHITALWRAGGRLPLSAAVALAKHFGLADPADLRSDALSRQIWAIVEANERHPEAPGWCPWCTADIFGGESHRAFCLPNNLWGAGRAAGSPIAETITLRPQARGARARGIPARGLKNLRCVRQMRQQDVAELLGMSSNYYARIERGEVPLQPDHADALASAFRVDKALIYARPQ